MLREGRQKRKEKIIFGEKLKGLVYVGETSRTIYEHAREHLRDSKAKEEDSHIAKHWEEKHKGEKMPSFKFNLVQSFRDPLSRQVSESVLQRKH